MLYHHRSLQRDIRDNDPNSSEGADNEPQGNKNHRRWSRVLCLSAAAWGLGYRDPVASTGHTTELQNISTSSYADSVRPRHFDL
jgi:hypothetical protein